jgi:hypothetical protein
MRVLRAKGRDRWSKAKRKDEVNLSEIPIAEQRGGEGDAGKQ